jgi:hypothetical protein
MVDQASRRRPAMQDRHALGLGIHEYEELVAELLHGADRVLLEHRLDHGSAWS